MFSEERYVTRDEGRLKAIRATHAGHSYFSPLLASMWTKQQRARAASVPEPAHSGDASRAHHGENGGELVSSAVCRGLNS
jgi:hypothetical protein